MSDPTFGNLDDEVRTLIAADVETAINDAVKAALWSRAASTEAALRRAVADIREVHREQKTVVVNDQTPIAVDYFFPATVVRSPLVEPGVAYILPSEAELDDVLREAGYGWDGEGPVVL